MKWLEINNSGPLKGRTIIPGSKNSSLGLLAASCLADEVVELGNIPDIADTRLMLDIVKSIGVNIYKANGKHLINGRGVTSAIIDPKSSVSFRTAYYFIGSLLAKHKKVSVGYPGGDNIGPRPIDQHIKGFKALGAKFTFYDNYYTVEADRLKGTEIYFDVITSGATINLMMAASLAKGRTILYNAARDPEVVDIAILLNKMGARIFGAGTDKIRIDGVEQLGGCTHNAIPDRLIAGAFLMAAGTTCGDITIDEVIPEHLEACMDKLTETGMEFEIHDSSITAHGCKNLKATRIKTGMYPVFATDHQQPVTALLLKARGRSVITERIYPERFNHCRELNKMGAEITVKNDTAYITGNQMLYGSKVHASDIRAGTCLVLAALSAQGTTYISGVEHIERGYEDIVGTFSSLGADIKLSHDDEEIKEAEALCLQSSAVKLT